MNDTLTFYNCRFSGGGDTQTYHRQNNLFELFVLTGGRDAQTLDVITCTQARMLAPRSHY